MHKSARQFFVDFCQKTTGRLLDHQGLRCTYFFQRILVLLRRFNSILLQNSFASVDYPNW